MQFFRSESFKEDKEVLLTRLRIFKTKDEPTEPGKSTPPESSSDKPPRYRRKSTRSDENVDAVSENSETSVPKEIAKTKTDEVVLVPKIATLSSKEPDVIKKEAKPMMESLKSRAAIFEQQSQKISPPNSLPIIKNATRFSLRDSSTKQTDLHAKNSFQDSSSNNREKGNGMNERKDSLDDLKDLDFIRNKRGETMRDERRRHTYETRERELEADRFKRISLESRSPK